MCDVCNGHPNCPCCGEEPRMIECTACAGKGHFYWAYDIRTGAETQCTETTYNILPDTEEEAERLNQNFCKGYDETCEVCDGTGKIEYDYDDYEQYYED